MIARAAFGIGLIWLVMPHPPLAGAAQAPMVRAPAMFEGRSLADVKREIGLSLAQHGGADVKAASANFAALMPKLLPWTRAPSRP